MVRTPVAALIGVALLLPACGGTKTRTPAAPAAKAVEAPRVAKAGGQEGGSGDVRTSDLDGDGRAELYRHYKQVPDPAKPGEQKTILARQDMDLNWDGKIDIWRYFDDKGLVQKEEWDSDYDGKVDEIRYFEDGVILRSERDRNNDGRFDVVRHYKAGKLERKESDTNDDGRIDRWEYYTGNLLDRVGIDRDHDGTVDTWAKAPGATAGN